MHILYSCTIGCFYINFDVAVTFASNLDRQLYKAITLVVYNSSTFKTNQRISGVHITVNVPLGLVRASGKSCSNCQS